MSGCSEKAVIYEPKTAFPKDAGDTSVQELQLLELSKNESLRFELLRLSILLRQS